MSYYTIFHLGGGSQVEAANAVDVAGPFPDWQTADQFGEDVYQKATGTSPATSIFGPRPTGYLAQELFFTVIELPSGKDTSQAVADRITNKYGD